MNYIIYRKIKFFPAIFNQKKTRGMERISKRQISDSYDYHGAFLFTTYSCLYDSFIRSWFLLFFFCHFYADFYSASFSNSFA